MPTIKVHIWHNNNGEIIAVGHPVAIDTLNHGVTPQCTYDQKVLEIEIDEKHAEDLQKTHIVDVKKQILVSHKKQ